MIKSIDWRNSSRMTSQLKNRYVRKLENYWQNFTCTRKSFVSNLSIFKSLSSERFLFSAGGKSPKVSILGSVLSFWKPVTFNCDLFSCISLFLQMSKNDHLVTDFCKILYSKKYKSKIMLLLDSKRWSLHVELIRSKLCTPLYFVVSHRLQLGLSVSIGRIFIKVSCKSVCSQCDLADFPCTPLCSVVQNESKELTTSSV